MNHQITLSSFFEGLEGHNAIFPETQYELVGFTGFDKGEGKTPYIEPILIQDFVLDAEQATQEDIDNYMAQQEVRNQLIDIINTFGSVKKVKQAIIDIYGENNARQQEEEMHAFLGNLSESEFALYEAIKVEDEYISELTDEEAIAYFEKEYESKIEAYYEKQGQSKTNEPSRNIESNSIKERSGQKATEPASEPATRKAERIKAADVKIDDIVNPSCRANNVIKLRDFRLLRQFAF